MKKVGHIEYEKKDMLSKQEYAVTFKSDEHSGGFGLGSSTAYITHSLDNARIMSMLALIAEELGIDLEAK